MLKRKTESSIGKMIEPSVRKFLLHNAKAVEKDNKVTIEESMEDLANAISYGICKSITSNPMQVAFSAGICPPAGGAVGTLIFTPLKISAKELK